MILKETNEQVISSRNLESQEFTIMADPKAFKVLSSNLYKNKIRAIIRELSTNALDAHIDAGLEGTQFDIHLPTQLDPSFWIRDYGNGMSKEQVFKLYTTYFASTKTDSNDFVGALGLGSKSPFSYTNSFTVASYQNGLLTVYTMSLINGVPNVSILFESATNEENGIKITLAVRSDDINRFWLEANYVYKTFTTKPNFIGRKAQYDLSIREHHGVNISNDSCFDYGVYAIMGNIPYPIAKEYYIGYKFLNHLASSNTVFVNFELGELDITPSREELSYDDDTINVLTERLESLSNHGYEVLTREFDGITDPRELYRATCNSGEHMFLRNLISIGNKTLNEWIEYYNVWNGNFTKFHSYNILDDGTIGSTRTTSSTSRHTNMRLAGISLEKIYILLNDDCNQPMKTIRNLHWYMPEIKGETLYRFDMHVSGAQAMQLIDLWNDPNRCIVLRNSEIRDCVMDSVPTKVRETHARRRNPNASTYTLNVDWLDSHDHFLSLDEVDEYEGYYIKVDINGAIYTEDGSSLACSESSLVALMQYNNIKSVLAVRIPQWKRITKNKNAFNITELFTSAFENVNMRNCALHTSDGHYNIPEWIKELRYYVPGAIPEAKLSSNKCYPIKGKYSLLVELKNQIEQDQYAIALLSKESTKNLRIYNGTLNAMVIHNNRISTKIRTKYSLIKQLVQSIDINKLSKEDISRIEYLLTSYKETHHACKNV